MGLRRLPRIDRLDLAVLTLPDWHPEAATDPRSPVYGYVIDHPDGAIVVDTGVGSGNQFIDEVYTPDHRALDGALAALGIAVESVVAVVNSHLHFDHCGQNPLLYGSDVPFFVQAAEIDAVEHDRYYTDATWALPPLPQRRLLDGDTAIAEGVTVLATPGHTAGHQSVVVDSTEGRVAIAAQAVWHWREYVDEVATPGNADAQLGDAAVDSIRRLKSLRPDRVLFSHCAEYRPDDART